MEQTSNALTPIFWRPMANGPSFQNANELTDQDISDSSGKGIKRKLASDANFSLSSNSSKKDDFSAIHEQNDSVTESTSSGSHIFENQPWADHIKRGIDMLSESLKEKEISLEKLNSSIANSYSMKILHKEACKDLKNFKEQAQNLHAIFAFLGGISELDVKINGLLSDSRQNLSTMEITTNSNQTNTSISTNALSLQTPKHLEVYKISQFPSI